MKKGKKDASGFNTLSLSQMGKINGGQWVEIKNPDGSIIYVWI